MRVWGEIGGGRRLRHQPQGGTLDVPGPRLYPKREPLACVTKTILGLEGGAVQAPSAIRGGWADPGAQNCSGA